jgi:hypothetical protein
MERIGDFVEVVDVNPVVQLASVRAAPRSQRLPAELAPLVDSYLVVEGANAAAAHGLLSALLTGGAFLLSGVYGTGKSHLLAMLGLLAEFPDARCRFTQRNPAWAPLLQPLADRRAFVAYISLDEFDPTAFALETIVANELAAEAQRKGFALPTETAARGEWLHTVWQTVHANGFAGIVVLLDELAMFLNAKSGEGLHRDASFLQFLAQATRRIPLLLVGALQRGAEDLQRIEPYALTQVRDRFQHTWVLSLAHALPLINQVLLRKRNEVTLRQRLSDLYRRSAWAQRFSAEHLFACYPFHPLTLRCLERSIGAFFSRTRSVVTFVQWAVRQRQDAEWQALITPDALIDHFEPDLHAHPQLRPFAQQVLLYFRRWDERHEAQGKVERMVKTLLAFQVGGEEPSAQTVAEALMQDADAIWAQLERLRTDANFVDAVRRTGSPDDTYRLDPQITVTDALHRRLNETMQALADEDPRLVRFAWECRSDEWAPPTLFEPRTLTVHWLRTQRRVLITVTDLRRVTAPQLHQVVANLASPHTDECLHLFVGVPVAVEEQRKHFSQLLSQLTRAGEVPAEPENRFAHAVAALLPRALKDAEMRRWKENAAVWLLAQDLSLAESELGMKVLERVREMLPARQWETQRLMQRLYSDGVLVSLLTGAAGLEMGRSIGSESAGFDALIRNAAERLLPQVFPHFPAIAPRKEASAQTYNALTRLILKGLPAAALDINARRWLELVAMPLGIVAVVPAEAPATSSLQVATPPSPLTDAVLHTVGSGAPYRQVEAEMAKSELGLTPELTQLLIAALLRSGRLLAFDRNKEAMQPEAITVPLARSVALLRPAQVLDDDAWRKVRPLLTALLEGVPDTLTPENQQRVWTQLRERANAWKLTTQDVSARLSQWMRELTQTERQWQRTVETLYLCAELTKVILQPLNAADGLRQLTAWAMERNLDAAVLQEWRDAFEATATFFASSAQLLSAWRYLNAMPPKGLREELARSRSSLMAQLRGGDELVGASASFTAEFRRFLDAYASAYLAHHERVHNGEAFQRLRQLQQSEAVRLLAALSALPDAPEDGRNALRQLQQALAKQCAETALTLRPHLLRQPVCARCGLALGETVREDVDAVENAVVEALRKLQAWLCDEPQRQRLRRYAEATTGAERALLERVGALTPQSPIAEWQTVIAAQGLIQKALSPFAVVDADLEELCGMLEGRYLTADEATILFRRWLDDKGASSETRLRFVRRTDKAPQRTRRNSEQAG